MSATYPDLNLSSFPDSVDSFLQFLNIVASDGPLIKQYMDAMNSGNQTLANQVLAQIPSANQKIITASDLNKLTQAMLAVERFYKTDIEPYVEEKQESWLQTMEQFTYRGVYAPGTTYQKNNLISYTTGGATLIYLATANPPAGTPPTNTNYWRLLTLQGTTGPSGEGLSYRQEWNASTIYDVNNAVSYGGALWMSLQGNNTNIIPGSNEAYWKLIVELQATIYPVQDTEPVAQKTGALWFNTAVQPTQYYYLSQLTNPATADKIIGPYEAFSQTGEKITGTAIAGKIPENATVTFGYHTNKDTIAMQIVENQQVVDYVGPIVEGKKVQAVIPQIAILTTFNVPPISSQDTLTEYDYYTDSTTGYRKTAVIINGACTIDTVSGGSSGGNM